MRKHSNGLIQQMAVFFLLAVAALSLVACSVLFNPESGATAVDDHDHAEDAHSHEEEAGDHSHDEGGAEGETQIDHHGNPVYDEEERVYEQYIQDGISIEFTVENFLGVGGRGGDFAPRIVEGEHAVLQFHVTDAATGAPLTGQRPAVWMDLYEGDDSEAACRANVEGYLSGALDARPVVDLNSYFILGMNSDNTISVIDPMVDVAGMTNLFAVILLQGTPDNWALTTNTAKLLITMPDLNKVAIADLDGFQVDANIDLPGRPSQIVVETGDRYAWVGIESEDRNAGGVAVIDIVEEKLLELIPTGRGAHDIAFSPDSSKGYVTNSEDGTVSIIDTEFLDVIDTIAPGGELVAAAVSPISGDVYLADQKNGMIFTLDARTNKIIAQIKAAGGLTDIAISPDGTWVFALNADKQTIFVIQAVSNLLTHAAPVNGAPENIVFTETAAYFRSASSPAIFAIPFDEINPTGNISVLTIPIGDLPPDFADAPVKADAIAVTPDRQALLISNPADDRIYFFIEGSQSALGGYQGHTLGPRAVRIVDRSMKERSAGVYNGSVRIPRAGEFSVAFLLADPQIVHCFKFTAKENEDLVVSQGKPDLEMNVLTELQPVSGESFVFEFELVYAESGERVAEGVEVIVLAKILAGNWSKRMSAVPLGEGRYRAEVVFPSNGVYQLLFSIPALGVDFDLLPPMTFQVEPAP